jgi:hypothetical protein
VAEESKREITAAVVKTIVEETLAAVTGNSVVSKWHCMHGDLVLNIVLLTQETANCSVTPLHQCQCNTFKNTAYLLMPKYLVSFQAQRNVGSYTSIDIKFQPVIYKNVCTT